MKPGIHPDYKLLTVRLVDGTTFQTRSTMKADHYTTDVDSSNHPFYTGKKTMVDTAGRVEKFMRRYRAAEQAAAAEAEAASEAAAAEAAPAEEAQA